MAPTFEVIQGSPTIDTPTRDTLSNMKKEISAWQQPSPSATDFRSGLQPLWLKT